MRERSAGSTSARPSTPGTIVTRTAPAGDSPQIYTLPCGQKVVGAGQKSGFYHVLDAATGQLVNQVQVEPGGTLGGLFADTAVSNGVVYANGINWPGGNPGVAPPTAGDLIAIAGDDSHELWRFITPQSSDMSGVAVANGVVYFTSMVYGELFALDQTNGNVLASVQISQPVGAWGGLRSKTEGSTSGRGSTSARRASLAESPRSACKAVEA